MTNEAEPRGYYFWKWADNDLHGDFIEIYTTLIRGEMHPALQPFDAMPLLRRLKKSASEGAKRGEEWDWKVIPSSSPKEARFVYVTCPQINASTANIRRFFENFLPLDLSGFDEQGFCQIPCVRPKINCFITGGTPPFVATYDIAADDLPGLIRGIPKDAPEPWGELLDRRNGVVAFAKGRRFEVEWRESPDVSAPTRYRQWRAQDRRRLELLAGKRDTDQPQINRDPDCLTFSDTLRIFQAFLRGEPRPEHYAWRELNNVDYA